MMTSFTALEDLNNAILDLQQADYNTYERPIKKIAAAVSDPDLEAISSELKSKVDFDEFIEKSNSGGSMVGSAQLNWPIEKELELGLTLHLIERAGNDPAWILSFSDTWFYDGNKIVAGLRKLTRSVLIPFARDYKSFLASRAAALDYQGKPSTPANGAAIENTHFEIGRVQSIASHNSVTLTLNLIALGEQLDDFMEQVRGSNSLEPAKKERYLNFLAQLQFNIKEISSSLPEAENHLTKAEAEVTASYLETYWEHLDANIGEFLSPARTAGLTVPLGIVALSTGVGTLFGQPIVGSILGAWLAGKVSPEKVVGKFLEGQRDITEPK